MKILILSSYYNRPILVERMLDSILVANQYHTDWELAILDDNSPIPLEPIIQKKMQSVANQVRTLNTNMSIQQKLDEGLAIGKFANQGIRESKADLGILLCDDDELYPTYLLDLSNYFSSHADVKYCYSKIQIHNPLVQDSNCLTHKYNQWSGPINPAAKVDASQIAWRLTCCKEDGAWFPETTKISDDSPLIKDTDRGFFENLYERCGYAQESGLIAQIKGVHEHQLLWHKNSDQTHLLNYYNEIEKLGGLVL